MTTGNGSSLMLAARIARREMRTGLKGFRIFIICLALGVGAIATVGSLNASVKAGLENDARRLLGGDLDLRTQHREAPAEALQYLEQNSTAMSRTIEMKAMAQTTNNGDDNSRRRALVELKAVDGAYPLVGAVELKPGLAFAGVLEKQNGVYGAVADPGLLLKLGIDVGERVQVGEADFEIRGVIAHEPDRVATVVNFGPRLMVSLDAIAATKLVQPGSQIHYHTRVLLAPQMADGFSERLEELFPDAGWRIRGLDNAAPGLERFSERFSLFLGFAGMTALLVGGFGVFGAVQSYLATKLETIATFKCIGAEGGLVFNAYLLQVMVLALVGILIGLVAGALLPLIGIELVKPYLPMQPLAGIYWGPLLQAATYGVLVAATFALWPLAQARETPAANLFRTLVVPVAAAPRREYLLLFIGGISLLALLTVLWAAEKNFAYWFIGVSALTILALHGGGQGVIALAKKAPHAKSATTRLAIANLHRPGNSTGRIVLSLGVGLSVLVGIALIQNNLANQINEQIPERAPSFFFIDIQPDQVEAFDQTVSGIEGADGLRRMPSLRGRIVRINGTPVEEAEIASGVRWAVRGDRALTYSALPAEGAEITKGEWWDENYSGAPLISFDEGVANGFGVDVGDTLTLNVLGREITATIASLRRIDWRTLRFDFAIIFDPVTLKGAPHSHIAAISVPASQEEETERRVTEAFPNISSIRVRDALEAANAMLAGISQAVRATASVTILSGIFVLAGTIAAGHAGRVYSSVIFKVLGATRAQVLGAFAVEYAVLGLFTGVVGTAVGTFISWAVITQLMGMSWSFYPLTAALTVLAGVFFTTLTGLGGTWISLGEKAAAHLRNE